VCHGFVVACFVSDRGSTVFMGANASGPSSHLYDNVDTEARSPNMLLTRIRSHPLGSAVECDYEVFDQVLGCGASAEVVRAVRKLDGHAFALKPIGKHLCSAEELASEVEVYLTLDHPNIARLYDVYETPTHINLVMELCGGGELYTRVMHNGAFAESEVQNVSLQMLRAVAYLHAHGIAHRDVKPENFVYESSDPGALLKLVDFGFSQEWDEVDLMTASCGTMAYMAPDVMRPGGYTTKSDVWSVGVIVFMLHSGSLPFQESEDEVRGAIQRGVEWDAVKLDVTAAAMDFVKGLLVVESFHRMSALEALRHQWLMPCLPHEVLDVKLIERMKRYVMGTPLRRALLQYLTLVLPLDGQIRAAFLSLDERSEGTIRFQVLKEAIRRSVQHTRLQTWATTENIFELFNVMDTNGDEQIYYSDFFAATIECTAEVRDRLVRAVFHRFGRSGEGSISREEIQVILGKTHEGRNTLDLLREVMNPNIPITGERLEEMMRGVVSL